MQNFQHAANLALQGFVEQVSMIAAELLGALEKVVTGAVRVRNTYKKRAADSKRAFGGVNVVMCADFWQLHPVSGTFIASNPTVLSPGSAYDVACMFWDDGPDSIRALWELTELVRCTDEWYNAFLGQCRRGSLTLEDYCYFHGLPTMASPCARCQCNADVEEDPLLGRCRKSWKAKFMAGSADMSEVIRSAEAACPECATERARRCRVISNLSAVPEEVRRSPFSGAPALYSFNVPRYFSTNLRAREFAKQENVQMTWCYATDVPLHPGDRELKTDALNEKRFAWLRRHDQDTGHIPSIYALAVGMPVRLTENVDRARQLFRGRKGFIHGWTLAPGCIPEEFDGEFILDRLPVVVYIRFPEAPSASNAPLPVDAGSRGDPR